MKSTITLYFPDEDMELLERLVRLSQLLGRSTSFLMRDALRNYIPVAERAEKRGEEPPRWSGIRPASCRE